MTRKFWIFIAVDTVIMVAVAAFLYSQFMVETGEKRDEKSVRASPSTSGSARAKDTGSGFNVIIVSLDTLRADRLGAYGYSRDTSPHFDALAKRGALFERNYSVTSWTLPAHMTLFTGVYPSSHGLVQGGHALKLGSELKLLAEILRDQGYKTVAHTGGGNISARWGFGRGFSVYTEDERKRRKGPVKGFAQSVKRVEPILAAADGPPFFLFLHTYDIHCPYVPPEPYFSMFNTPGAVPTDTARCGPAFEKEGALSKGQAQFVSDRYDGGIRWADESLGALVSLLDEHNLFESTYLIVTSDHGEELNEHGRVGHRLSLHRQLLETPLLIVGPGIEPRRVENSSSLVDIFPTTLQLLGLPTPAYVQGRSLVPELMGSAEPYTEPEWAEMDRGIVLRSRMSPEWHLILDIEKDRPELFSREHDRDELTSVAEEHPEVAASQAKETREFFEQRHRFTTETRREDSSRERKQLESLGYL